MLYCILLTLCSWQQRVGYTIEVNLDVDNKKLSGIEYFFYYNNAPIALETIYLHIYPNAYKDIHTAFSRETELVPGANFRDAGLKTRSWININRVSIDTREIRFSVDTTILAVILDQPLNSDDSLKLVIDFELKIPKIFSRLGYHGDHYEFVQWYPKACVFDQNGWHLDTYHAIGEFYGEFGAYDVTINLPGDYIIAATGKQIPTCDHEKADLYNNRKSVRFQADNIHDFAWVCDPDFIMEKVNVDSIEVKIYFQKKHRRKWRNAGVYAIGAVSRYNRWFGKYPFHDLSIVEGMSPMSGMEYPMLVIIGETEDPLTRLFESCIAHEIGHQWFYGVLGFNEMDEAWLDEGLTTYAENRYFEDRYGKYGSLFKTSYLPPFSKRYYNKLFYYLTQTNGLEKPILAPAYELCKEPIVYLNNAYSKPTLFLTNLESILGREIFEKAIQTLYDRFKFKHTSTDDFINIFEEVSGRELDSIFYYFLNTTEYCDWDIKRVSKNEVTVINNGKWLIPADVLIRTRHGAQMFYIDGARSKQTFVVADEMGSIQSVTIDPNDNCIDINRWNNHYPARISIKPYIQFPSFDAYQILVLPYPWYGTDDGVTLNLYLFGARFIDYDVFKGQHQWLAGCSYGTKNGNISTSLNYQTPLVFKKNWRMRINLKGSQNWWKENVGVGLTHNIGVAFTEKPKYEISNFADYFQLKSLDAVDSTDWELGRIVTLNNHIKFKSGSDEIILSVSAAHEYMGSDYDFLKASLILKKDIKTFVPISMRLFGGYIIGDAPLQDNFFLSGALHITTIPDLVFGQKGYFSPQEHIHIPGDANMRGYQTMHIKSKNIVALNMEFPSRSLLRVFADIGWYDQWAWDAGVRLVLGPLSFNVPFYVKDDPWRVHWSIGF